MAATNGKSSRPASSQRHAASATSAVTSGTGHRNRMLGNENQRAAIRSNASGVQRLTTAMNASTATSSSFACARAHAKLLLVAVLAFMAVVSLWTPLAFERIAARWFSFPNILFLWPVPLVTALVALAAWRWLDAGRELLPFVAAIALFLLGYLGLVISIFPYLVPPALTIWQTAAVPASQIFMLLGTLPLLPLILAYVAFIYWIFRGKV